MLITHSCIIDFIVKLLEIIFFLKFLSKFVFQLVTDSGSFAQEMCFASNFE